MNEELGINALAPPAQVLLYAALPRTEPSADGFLPFQGVGLCTEKRLGICIALSVSILKMLILGAVRLQIRPGWVFS